MLLSHQFILFTLILLFSLCLVHFAIRSFTESKEVSFSLSLVHFACKVMTLFSHHFAIILHAKWLLRLNFSLMKKVKEGRRPSFLAEGRILQDVKAINERGRPPSVSNSKLHCSSKLY